jgi:hypothetical protein
MASVPVAEVGVGLMVRSPHIHGRQAQRPAMRSGKRCKIPNRHSTSRDRLADHHKTRKDSGVAESRVSQRLDQTLFRR